MATADNPGGQAWFRLLLYKEDIIRLEGLLQQVIDTHELEGCFLADAWGALIVIRGRVPVHLAETLSAQVLSGSVPQALSLGSGMFIVGIRAEQPLPLAKGTGETLRQMLAGLERTTTRYFGATP